MKNKSAISLAVLVLTPFLLMGVAPSRMAVAAPPGFVDTANYTFDQIRDWFDEHFAIDVGYAYAPPGEPWKTYPTTQYGGVTRYGYRDRSVDWSATATAYGWTGSECRAAGGDC